MDKPRGPCASVVSCAMHSPLLTLIVLPTTTAATLAIATTTTKRLSAYSFSYLLRISRLLSSVGLVSILGTGTNLQRGTIVILWEPTYDAKVAKQIPKRCHRQWQNQDVHHYVLHARTLIELEVDKQRKTKSGFTANDCA